MANSKGILDTIVDNAENQLRGTIRSAKRTLFEDSINAMRQDADRLLNKMRDHIVDSMTGATDDMFENLRGLASGNLVNPVSNAYNKMMNKVDAIVDKNLQLANQYLSGTAQSMLNRAGNTLGIGDIGSSLIKTNSYSPTVVTRVSKLWKQAYKGAPESEWDYIDVVSSAVDLPMYIKAALEESGYIADKYRGIQYAKDLHFITRPTLEADNGGFYRSYAFLTRPNLNIVRRSGDTIELVPEMSRYPNFAALAMTDLNLAAELCRDGANKSNLFTYVNNYIKEVPAIRLSESNREGVKNMYGKSIPVPGIPEIYGEVDIPITFIDNGRGDIAKLMYMLSTYKSIVGREGFPMRAEYIKYKGIDYLMSLYIVTVDANWEIVGFGVAIGLMISEPPTHFTQHKMDGFGKNELLEEFTVNFKAATYIPYAPEYYDDFNRISGFDPSNIVSTRGSGHNFVMDDRALSTSDPNHNLRGSVWSTTGGFDGSGNIVINQSTGTSQVAAKNMVQSVISNFFKPASEQTLDREVNTINAVKRYPDVMELAGRCPGVYTGTNSKEPNRRRFYLGFSY